MSRGVDTEVEEMLGSVGQLVHVPKVTADCHYSTRRTKETTHRSIAASGPIVTCRLFLCRDHVLATQISGVGPKENKKVETPEI